MSLTYDGKTLIGERVARALDAASTLQRFEEKHLAFIEANPPELASAFLTKPWVSWPASYLDKMAQYFGNDGWTACAHSREKIVDGVTVAVHGLEESKVSVALIAPVSTQSAGVNAPGYSIGIAKQSLN